MLTEIPTLSLTFGGMTPPKIPTSLGALYVAEIRLAFNAIKEAKSSKFKLSDAGQSHNFSKKMNSDFNSPTFMSIL